MKHAPAPTLCASCLKVFHDQVELAPTSEATNGVAWCPHRGTLAVATLLAGEVRRMIVHGPLEEAEAAGMIRELEAAATTPVSRSRALPLN